MSPRVRRRRTTRAYTEALAQLSAAGVDSVSTAITDNKGMNLAIDLGLLDGEESMDLARPFGAGPCRADAAAPRGGGGGSGR